MGEVTIDTEWESAITFGHCIVACEMKGLIPQTRLDAARNSASVVFDGWGSHDLNVRLSTQLRRMFMLTSISGTSSRADWVTVFFLAK